MARKEKVVAQNPDGVQLVRITFKNEGKAPECFYDNTRNLVIVKPGETKTWDELRFNPPPFKAVAAEGDADKSAAGGKSEGNKDSADRKGAEGSGKPAA